MALPEATTELHQKHLGHQHGVAGALSIRLVEARNLQAAASMFWLRTCNPYVIFRLGRSQARSRTIQNSGNPSWRRENFTMRVPKLDLQRNPLTEHSNVRMELQIDVMNEDSLIKGRATESVGMTTGSLIGTAALDFTGLLEGREEVLDQWVTINSGVDSVNVDGSKGKKKGQMNMLGEVRIILQYDPNGMEPQIGDFVRMEGFGPYPSALLKPIDQLEFVVKKVSGSYVLCGYTTKSGYDASVRLHRNNVYVSHRGNLIDKVYMKCIERPLTFARHTPLGQTLERFLTPYVRLAKAMSMPALMAARGTVTTTLRITSAAMGAAFMTSEYS